jgi:menaquinone-9 beta-reductase
MGTSRSSDVLVIGAGPAGSTAATVLAQAGVRVHLIDRATFPRDKLCGDTINPGALSALEGHGLASRVRSLGVPLDGMRLTGEGGVEVRGLYPRGLQGRALTRRVLDGELLQAAIQAGAEFDQGTAARRPLVRETGAGALVSGAIVDAIPGERELPARVTIACDGRRSAIAFRLGLSRHPRRPRRWAIGMYYDGVAGVSSVGEMHVRDDRYIGMTAVPGGLVNVCLVRQSWQGESRHSGPGAMVAEAIAQDTELRERFSGARPVSRAMVLGPLAVDTVHPWPEGLLMAGDAAGFIDPITGDGLRFAIRGGQLAAEAALRALEHGWLGVHGWLLRERQREFGTKWRFNRALRKLVDSREALAAARIGARLWPRLVRSAILYAGDCGCSV